MKTFRLETIMRVEPDEKGNIPYIPFQSGAGGISAAGWTNLFIGLDAPDETAAVAKAKERALSIFPKAYVIAVWRVNVLGERQTQLWQAY